MLLLCALVCLLISGIRWPLVNGRADTGLNLEELTEAAYPEIFNAAKESIITTNATCGQSGPEAYCHYRPDGRESECDVCDSASLNQDRRHPIQNAIDNSSNWWQSPSLQSGRRFEYVTITIDLKQEFHIHYVRIKAARSPLPGNWILERSIDGTFYKPWQYFATSNTDCWRYYGTKPSSQRPSTFRIDDDVVCTSHHASSRQLQNGEINVNLIEGRPGAELFSSSLKEFIKARFIRMRFQKFMAPAEERLTLDYSRSSNQTIANQMYYTLREIEVGAQCMCNGHAKKCPIDRVTQLRQCECLHNTCGDSCMKCCPLFNQRPFKPATKRQAAVCEACECHGHSDHCVYDAAVASRNASINALGKRQGGGVCVDCKHHTTGNNCDQCVDGYFRPKGMPKNATNPCRECQCRGRGTTEFCVKDDSHALEGLSPGDCICKEGFQGKNCEQCAPGYINYPRCSSCFCKQEGITIPACEGYCRCKKNVEGLRCGDCKPGFYNLAADNPEGCSSCFCFGATSSCKSSDWGIEIISSPITYLPEWRVSDLNGQKVLNPQFKEDRLVIADDDMSVPKPYYWQAPREYLGQKLYSYGGDLRFLIGATILRGDVSGFYTEEPDIIIEGGSDNLRMGHNWKKHDFDEENKALITLPLREQDWFVLDRGGHKVRPATREEFTLAIYDLKRMLIRAKFHTDQVEGSLYQVEMEKASNDSKSLQKQIGAEACNCPEGYAGLSCELCAPGYRRVNNVLVGGQCVKCECNNHADSCDPYTGECSECLHNTEGPNCARCKSGFYGIVTGKIDDCKPCACPLTIPSNNFSPTCHATPDGDYECDECQHPYTGKKCELCKDGFYGEPTVPGGECLPCDCAANVNTSIPGWCDSKTGQCRCEGNITGWKCDQCPKDHWGMAEIGDCRPCGCHGPGSLDSQCDPKTGQCPCKPNFTGRWCDMCAIGYGSTELDCPPCACNPVGSQSLECNQASGKCYCKPGVFGQHCTKCMDGYYGFGPEGCSPCDCHPKGSEDEICDEATGQCKCKPYVIGRDCSRCAPGTWNIDSGRGCENCNCDPIGSISPDCDITTGQCQCKPGVGGLKCDQCKPGYYGLSATGCLKCDECYEPNHICNPKTGKCECPPNTAGKDCRDCAPGTYGLDILAGCKVCECNVQGSVDPIQCHNKTGQCLCLDGFEGLNCDRCRFGFYRFPNCRRCDCYPPGTKIDACRVELRPETSFQDGPPKICQCDDTGQCPCRTNTMGRRCDRCKDSTFSLTDSNPSGCFSCFCFERTSRCDQSKTFWHAVHAQPREVSFGFTDTPPESRLGFNVIPSDGDNAIIGSNSITDQPYYWQLPKEFLGDHVGSYNGFLTFRIQSKGGSRFPDEVMKRYPLVIIQGNHRLTFYHFEEESLSPISPFIGNLHKVQLHESSWIMAENPRQEVTRKHMMIALQKVQHILIRATHGPDTQSSSINDVMMDTSSDVIRTPSLNYTAIGVEQCRCPPQYTGPSCQDPNIGYCRKRKPNYLDSKDYIDLVGWAEPCQCNNRSNVCDRETCHCFNCTANTAGPYCNICAPGHYGDPTQNIPCLPCACPLPGHSFAKSCETRPGNPNDYICECEEGYTGERCEKCAPGYFGNPLEKERCLACNCSPYGSIGNTCDPRTGQCICKEGFRGRDCSICLPRHVQTEQGCISCDGPCEGLLLDDLDSINATLSDFPPDWPKLPYIKFLHLLAKFNNFLKEYQQRKLVIANGRDLLESIRAGFGLDTFAQMLMLLEEELENRATQADIAAHQTVGEAEALLDLMQDLHDELLKIVKQLRQLAGEGSIQDQNMAMMLKRAEQILSELTIRNFGPRREQAEREYRKAKALLDRILALLKLPRLDQKWADRLNRLMKLLSAVIKENQERVQQPLQIAIASIERGQRVKNTVLSDLRKSEDLGQQAERDLAEARLLINRARAALDDFDARRGLFPGMERHLRDAALRLKELYEKLFRLNPEYSVKYVDACRSHAQQLQNQLDYLKSLFFDTENVSRYAMVAANVYQRIIDAINRAEKSAQRAHEAAERAYKEVYPSTDQSVLKWAANAKEKSQRLLEAAKALKDKAALLKQDLDGKKAALDRLENELSGFTREINTLIEEIERVETQMKTMMGKTDAEISATLENLGRIHSRIDTIVNLITTELTTGLKRLEDGTASGLDNITKLIEQARANIRDSLRLLVSSENLRDRVNRIMERLDIDLTDLRHRIMLSRQKASSIRISLKADRDEICYKSYRPETEPSSSNSISLNYAIDDDRIQNSILLYISEKSPNISLNERDFMCVEMVNRKIRLSWNLGYGPRSIEHPLRIETMDRTYKSIDGWYKIEVVRINNVAQLIVRPSSSTHKPDLQSVSASSDSRGTRANFNSKSDFYIGSLPDEIQTTKAINNRRFIGCIHEVFFDEKRIGLWNFITSQGCHGCVEGFIEPYDHETFFFKGDQSYALMDQIQHYDREKYMIAFHFKTFDENAMIFFTGNPDTGDFVSIALEGGVVIYQLGIANSARLQLRSSQKYNTGKWVRLAAEREGLHGSLYVEDEIQEGNIERTSSSPQLDLNHVQIYFGGVVPNFTQSAWHNVIFKSFLGCMKSVQIDATPLNLLNIESFGVLAGCKDRTWRSARFYGHGYLELKGHPIREDDDLSFTVATNQSDVLLLLSTFAGLSPQRFKDSHFYSLAIVNGLLEIRINGGAGSIVLVSETRINDGQYHTISLSRRKRKVTVSLDDRESTFSRLSKGSTVIEASDKGGLYLGGAPDFIMLRGMANTKTGLVGVIRDFAFSGKIVKLNEPVSFRDVGIGR